MPYATNKNNSYAKKYQKTGKNMMDILTHAHHTSFMFILLLSELIFSLSMIVTTGPD